MLDLWLWLTIAHIYRSFLLLFLVLVLGIVDVDYDNSVDIWNKDSMFYIYLQSLLICFACLPFCFRAMFAICFG
jgi:hypothetical protein